MGANPGPSGSMPPPYLSLVIPTRNDTYPSNVLAIQNKCLAVLQRQMEDAGIPAEIIVVEYNPDPSRPPLRESLQVGPARCITIKVIGVPPEYHRRLRYWEKRVFHQSLAVNVGLRRSRGQFFVYRAADHIYSEGLVSFLSKMSLSQDSIYRCDRYDIDATAFDEISAGDPAAITSIFEKH